MATWGYSERLLGGDESGTEISLDMISIPSGKFIMGAPKSEVDSRDNERPPHEVTLQSFYLGRSPNHPGTMAGRGGLSSNSAKVGSQPIKIRGR